MQMHDFRSWHDESELPTANYQLTTTSTNWRRANAHMHRPTRRNADDHQLESMIVGVGWASRQPVWSHLNFGTSLTCGDQNIIGRMRLDDVLDDESLVDELSEEVGLRHRAQEQLSDLLRLGNLINHLNEHTTISRVR